MPTLFSDPLPHSVPSNTSDLGPSLLPLHVSAEDPSIDPDVELDTLNSQGHELTTSSATGRIEKHFGASGNSGKVDSEEEDESFLSSSDSGIEHTQLLGDSSRQLRTQMKRSKRNNASLKRGSSRPDLKVEISENGRSNGSMNSHIEMRRQKEGSFESSASQTNRLMNRSGFTLDDEPPPTPQTPSYNTTSFWDLPIKDRKNFLLLVLLYFLQGIPLGLASGSVPFLLKPYLSYGQIGVFSLASYPYSLKLLWSPIVDAVWSQRFGRRKSWIMPIQTISGFAMIYLGGRIDKMMTAAGENGGAGVWDFTGWWFLLVFFCATQDIAVDGWAISLLSSQNIAYASTAQTVGLTAGQFLSYTVFLAFNSPDFANKWFRSTPKGEGLLSLGGYLSFWGWAYLVVTIGLAVFKQEERSKDRDGILKVYKSMWGVLKLKNIHTIIIVHLIAKIGFQANDAVTSLKLLDKNFGQDNMALVVLIDFPFEIALGYYAGKWSTKYTPMKVWSWAFVGRLFAAMVAQGTIMIFPEGPGDPNNPIPVPLWYILTVIGEHVFSTFMMTVMFVAVSAFHARVSDPAIGGTYMTLLATVSNLGGTFPKFFVLKLVDLFTEATCIPPPEPPSDATEVLKGPFSCALEADRHRCKAGGGACLVERDGYYMTNIICVLIGTLTFWLYIRPSVLRLQKLPLRAWRLSGTDRDP